MFVLNYNYVVQILVKLHLSSLHVVIHFQNKLLLLQNKIKLHVQEICSKT